MLLWPANGIEVVTNFDSFMKADGRASSQRDVCMQALGEQKVETNYRQNTRQRDTEPLWRRNSCPYDACRNYPEY